MAFGFTPKFEQSLDLNGLDPEHYLVIALDAAEKLEWNVNYISKSGFIAIVGGGLFTSIEQITVLLRDDTVSITSKNLSSGMFDWGKNKKHVEAFIDEFETVQSGLTEDQIKQKVDEIKPKLELQEDDLLTAPPATAKQNLQSFLSFFIPREGYYITPIMININIMVFILMVFSGVSAFEPTINSLIAWGADLGVLTLDGQWWRLLTSVFVHIGILHLLLNMYALLYIGLLLEPYLGKIKFLAAYLFTAILASITSIFWHPFTVSAGASGAIFGLYGVFLAMLTTNFIDKKTRSALFASIGIFVVFNLMNGMKAGIDNAAHIGGLASGLVIGYCYYPSLKKPDSLKISYVTIALLFMAALSASFVIYSKIPNDMTEYSKKMKEFSVNEQAALDVFNGKKITGPAMLPYIQSQGIDNWKRNLKIMNELNKLNIPEQLKNRDNAIKRYCGLQLTKYQLLYKAIEQNNTLQYDSSIDSCNKQIQSVIDSLKGK